MSALKKTFILTACAALTLAIASCGKGKTAAGGNDAAEQTTSGVPEFKSDSIAWTDSVKSRTASALCVIKADYPTAGGAQLVDSIRQWIASRLTVDMLSINTGAKIPVPAQAALSDGKALIADAGKAALASALPELQSLDSLDREPGMMYEYRWNFSNSFDTDSVVTYLMTTYVYLGGAHGSSTTVGQTFRASDGTELTVSDLFRPDSLPAVRNLVKRGLMSQYFQVASAEELRAGLLIDPDTLPLPANPPYFEKDGVTFTYQQYEIAPYAAGMPECTLPYAELKPMMTPGAAALVVKK